MDRCYIVSSPDCHTLRAKEGPEQLLQILGPSIKRLFHSKRTFIMNALFSGKLFLATVPRCYRLYCIKICFAKCNLIFVFHLHKKFNIINCELLLLLCLVDLREVADLYRKRSYIMIRELHAKETQIKQLQSMTVERHPELSGMFFISALNRTLIMFCLN